MTHFSSFSALSLLVIAAALSGACADTPAANEPHACIQGSSTGPVGSVVVNVTGLPEANVAATINLAGPSGVTVLDASIEIADNTAGSYSVTAFPVTKADPIVRTVYEPKVSVSTFCLEGGQTQTIDVTYTQVATSNKLWVANADNSTASLQGFASVSLRDTGAPGSSVAAKASLKSAAFDQGGNLWVLGATSADAPIGRFAAADFGASGNKTPDRKITTVPSSMCRPGYSGMAFDLNGNLWVTAACANEAVRFTPEQLDAQGAPAPNVKIGGMAAPTGVAFDKYGNMWIASEDTKSVLRYDVSRLDASTNGAPNEIVAVKTASGGDLAPSALAFDKDGSLWATSVGANIIYKLTTSELGATGAQTVVPSIQLTLNISALLGGMAFDESGSLWLTYSNGEVARLARSQLATSSGAGTPTIPETLISSANIGSAVAMAFYPAPVGLGLFPTVPW